MTSQRGFHIVLALVIGAPVLTMVAALYQMLGTGGEGLILPARVAQPAVEPAPTATAAGAAAPTNVAALPAIVAPAANAPATPGRGARDFTTPAAAWQAGLARSDADAGKQLAQAGKPAQGVQACVTCHGAAGITPLGGAFPNLAGLSAEYLSKQLWDFREETRPHPLMSKIAQALSEQEIADISRYYGGLPHAAPRPSGAASTFADAARLDIKGDGPRALPACANCHGLQGRGEGVLLPRLAGQPAVYFIDQMNGFRGATRQNDDVGVMRAFAQRLTPEEIIQLARYYESMGTALPDAGAR